MACKNGVKIFTALYHSGNAPVAHMVGKLQGAGLPVRVQQTSDGNTMMEIDLPFQVPQVLTAILSEDDLFKFMAAVDGKTE